MSPVVRPRRRPSHRTPGRPARQAKASRYRGPISRLKGGKRARLPDRDHALLAAPEQVSGDSARESLTPNKHRAPMIRLLALPRGMKVLWHTRPRTPGAPAAMEDLMQYYDLGSYTRKITTALPRAPIWFDRGLNRLSGANHAEAMAWFKKVLAHDPGCAMAYWGISYAAGPNCNLPWHRYDPAGKAAALAAAYDAMQGALAHAGSASAVEQALIRALPARYPKREPIEDQAPWDAAYADAMRRVFHAYRDDLEVREVFAEAIMNLTPWKMWDLKTGGVAEGAGTLEAMEVLESALRDFPAAWDHPGLLHLYVHL